MPEDTSTRDETSRIRISPDERDPAAVERLLHALPSWFGIEAANAHYVESARHLPSYVARVDGDDIVGVLLVRRHYPWAAEIYLLLVHPDLHRRRIGTALVSAAEADLAADGVELLHVKTLGPSRPHDGYAATRAFYAAAGFRSIEELTDLWPGNPCLLMVKSLRPAAHVGA